MIHLEKLTKKYGNFLAVNNLSTDIAKGEIYGFIGLNGAGKTTTIRMMLGMIHPDAGSVFIDGQKISASSTRIWKKTGHLAEVPYSCPQLTVFENLELTRRLRGIKSRRRVDEIIDSMGLTPYRDRKAGILSQGNAQRLGLARALIHKPEILILDEPTNGLDPAGIVEIRELLTELSVKEGVTIFISSHILDELARFTTRIGMIHLGRMVEERDTESLKNLYSQEVIVKVREPEPALALLHKNNFENSRLENDSIIIAGDKALNKSEEIASLLVKGGYPPYLLKPGEQNLGTYFLNKINPKGGLK